MNISGLAIRRPVATVLLAVAVALCGAVSFALLPVAPLPRIEAPAIFVSAALPGASPEVMASTVATPLERRLAAIADLDDMTSTNSVGSTSIQLTFGSDRNIEGAASDVQAAIEAARADLPVGLPRAPSYFKLNSSVFPVMAIAMTSDVLTQGQIYDAADAVISQRLAQIKGVGAVNVNGSALPAIRIEANPLALAQYGIGLEDLRAAISNANANAPKGAVEAAGLRYQIYTNDNARDASTYRQLIVAARNGATVRLGDVATVTGLEDGAPENIRTYGLYNGKAAVSVLIFQQPGANVVEMVDAVKAELPSLRQSIDPKIDLIPIFDRSVTIRGSLRQVEQTLVLSVVMVIVVVYLFLRGLRTALIPAVVVPVSLIGTVAAMYLLGYTIDNFSLMALTIATGFVVDDAIVVMENTNRLIDQGMGRMRAALVGAGEVGFTVLSMSVSLIAIFIPFMLAKGIVGILFREFTVTLSVAILISLAVSLTVTPMMCARLLSGDSTRRGSAFDRGFDALRVDYQRSLEWALRHRHLVMAGLLGVIALNVFLYREIPKGFFPQQDTGQLQGVVRGDASASFEFMKRKLVEVSDIIRSDRDVASVTGSVGGNGFGPFGGAGANASLNIVLRPLAARSASAEQVIARLRPRLARISGARTYLQAIQDFGGGGGRAANSQFQYTLLGDDLGELRDWSRRIRAALQDVPEIRDLDSDLQPAGWEARLVVDRDSASRLGLTEVQIDNTLADAFSQAQVSTVLNPASPQQYHVVMEVAPQFWQDPDILSQLYVSTAAGPVTGTAATQAVTSGSAQDLQRNASLNSLANGGHGNTSSAAAVSVIAETMVPLSAFSRFESNTAPSSVNHTGVSASTAMAFNLPPGEALDVALQAIDRTMQRIHAPIGIHGASYGTAKLFQDSITSLPLLLVAALIVIYTVLGMLYESFSQPLTILSTLPSAGIGALLALLATHTEFSLIAFIGILLVAGIVTKNAIMMVDFALDAERGSALNPAAAIARAAAMRLRPILMTTGAAMAGALPLAIAHGDGTEIRRPLGIAVLGGLVVSQLLTLYTTPIVYLYVRRLWPRATSASTQVLTKHGGSMLDAV